MPDRRRFKEPGFNFRPLRLAVLALVALVFGIGFGSMVSTLFRGSGEKKPAIETEIDRKPAIPAPAPAATPTQPAEEKRGEAPILPPPTIKSDAAWLKHAVAAPERKDRPWIAVVFDDVGLDRKRSLRAIELPGPLTISFMTYAEDLPNLARAAKARGHEIMLHVPMEPESSSENPGPNALLVSAGAEENLKRLRWGLDRLEGIVGINNHMGSRFTATEPALRPVMAELRSRGLLFLDSRTTSSTVAARMAQSMGVPSAARDVFLDHYDSTAHIHDAFDRVEQVAKQQGHAIAIGHPHDRSIEALAEWLPRLAGRGFVLAPVSAVVKKRLDNGHGGNGNTAARTVN